MTSKVHKVSKIRSSQDMAGIKLTAPEVSALLGDEERLKGLGIELPPVNASIACDTIIPPAVTDPSVGVPVQFLQSWLAGQVFTLTQARKADMLAPVMTVGDWADQQIVQTSVEFLGKAGLYKDHGDVPLVSSNIVYDVRDIVRFEAGLQVTMLEADRAVKQGVDPSALKREALTRGFELLRNDIFFNGYCENGLKVYGFLNDPNLPAFVEVASNTQAKKKWSEKGANDRITDILTAVATLRMQSGANIDPMVDKLILALPTSCIDLLREVDKGNTLGFTPMKWLNENYPNIEIVPVPQLEKATGNDAGFYLYAESVPDSGTDDESTMLQLVPTRVKSLNAVTTTKGFEEAYSNALGGCFVKRPYAVVRYNGI